MSNRIQSIAATIFALMFVAVMALIQTNVLNFGNNVNDQLTRTNINTEMHELAAFDDTTVTGATVISAIRNYSTLYDYEMKIIVKTGSGGVSETSYGAGGDHAKYEVTSPSNVYYIDPTASFTAKLASNTNGIITDIVFTQV